MQQDTIIATLGLLTAILLVSANLVITHVLAQTVPVALGLACLLYLVARRFSDERTLAVKAFAYPQIGLVVALFGTTLLVLVTALTGGRTVHFYAIASLLGTFLLLQIFFTPDRYLHPGSILVQVVLFVAVLRLPALYATPGFIGIDVWVHVPDLTQSLVETGSVEGMGETKYVGSPLYHLLIAATSLFTGLSLRDALYVSLGTALILSTLLLYSVSKFFLSPRWSLFVVAIYGMSDYFIRWGLHLIPTSMSIALFFGILFFLVRRIEAISTRADEVLLILLFVALALTHQLSSVIVLTILGGAVLAHTLYTSSLFPLTTTTNVRPNPVPITVIPLLSYFVFKAGLLSFTWSQTPYYGQTLLDGAVTTLQEDIATLTEGGGESEAMAGDRGDDEQTPWQTFVTYLDWTGYLLLLFGTAVGTLVSTQVERLSATRFVVVVSVAILTVITLVPPVLGIDSLLPGRWYPFLYAGMAILAAIGFGYLRSDLAVPLFVVCAVLFALVYPGAMIFATTATPDNPAFEEDAIKYSYTESELAAAETLGERTTEDEGAIFSDHPYVLVLNRLDEVRFGVASIEEDGTVAGDRVIYRSYQSSGAPRFSVDGDSQLQQVSEEQACSPSKHKSYTNGDVTLCVE